MKQGADASARPGDRERPLTVEALVRAASLLLEEKLGAVWVEGEVSSLKSPGSGHIYFTLRDRRSQIAAVMWRSTAQRLRFRLEEGQRFLVRGKLSIYPEQGRCQLYVDAIEPAGLGAAALALEQRKQRLAAEGLFDPARKRRLPRMPARVGVVTSPTGAAVRDVIRAIERRFPTPILIAPTRVQGDGAAQDIVEAIHRVASAPGVAVVIVGRGGGSQEDLSAFNDEGVVRAIATCRVPVISAVGHEIDVTLADLAADARAATPTAAGELAVPDRAALKEELGGLTVRLGREARHAFARVRARLERLAGRVGDPRVVVAARRQRLAAFDKRLVALHPRARLGANRAAVDALSGRAAAAVRAALAGRQRGLERGAAGLDAMSPLRVLDRGYAIARLPDGTVVASVAAVAPGDDLSVRVADGEVDVTVKGTRRK